MMLYVMNLLVSLLSIVRSVAISLLVALAFFALAAKMAQANFPQENGKPPFKRAMVFSGGGFSAASFIGMYDAAIEAGIQPDVIFGTCGSSISASVIAAFPDQRERIQFMLSPTFQRFLRLPKPKLGLLNGGLGLYIDSYLDGYNIVPEIFTKTLFYLPRFNRVSREFHRRIQQRGDGPRVVILAAETRTLKPDMEARPWWPTKKHGSQGRYFSETVFTDADTARYFQGLRSTVNRQFPGSRIARRLNVITDWSYYNAVRASISEPFLLNPHHDPNTDRYYFGSFVNLYPYELARRLADEIIMTYAGPSDDTSNRQIFRTYGFQPNHMLYCVSKRPVDRWVDFTDKAEVDYKVGMGYTLEIDPGDLPGVGSFKNNVPEDLKEYRKRTMTLYNYGYQRMKESLQQKRASTGHIRHPRKDSDYPNVECR